MKLVTRTALAYAILTAFILFVFAYSVYFVSEKNRKDEFFDRLDYKITWRAEFIFDAQINKDLIKFLHTKNKKKDFLCYYFFFYMIKKNPQTIFV